jgi:2-polyprenyl-6-methoxyphenol hydroxylase-like FAD-dependent oxidoreductase
MPGLPVSTEVLIVGAGPTGLALATSLAQTGVDHVLIDKLQEAQGTSRAAVIHAHTLEALEELQVSENLSSAGLKLDRFAIRDRDETLLSLNFARAPSNYPFLLMLTQDVTERLLSARLAEAGGVIHRGTSAERIIAHRDHVEVETSGEGGARKIRARYVVGADGMHSLVRSVANIAFEGAQYEESFVLADVHMDWPHGRDDVKLFFSPEGLVVVAPLPDGRFRIVATVDDAPERPGSADIQAIIDARGPTRGKVIVHDDVSWSSRFRLHHRLAKAYRKGRLLLMGDAAHVHSPAGGQGMNTGLVDAVVLGRLLAVVVKGAEPDRTLDHYERLRRPAAAKVLKLAGGLTEMATVKSSHGRALRNMRLRAMASLAPAKRHLVMQLSGLSRRALARTPVDMEGLSR